MSWGIVSIMMNSMGGRYFITLFLVMKRYGSTFLHWYLGFMYSPSPLRRALSFAVFSCATFLAVLSFLSLIDPYPLKDWNYLRLSLQEMGFAGPLVFILLVAVLPLFSPLSLLIVTGSATFGALPGLILSYLGSLINANIAFFLVKALGVEDRWGNKDRQAAIKKSIQRHGYPIVLVLQLVAVFPFVAVNSAAAAAGVEWRDFMKATLVGVLPSMTIYSFFGERIVIEFFSPRAYFAVIIVVFLAIVLLALRKKVSSSQRNGHISDIS